MKNQKLNHFLLLISFFVMIQVNAATYTTKGNQGSFPYRTDATKWVSNSVPPATLANNDIVTISAGDIATRNADFTGNNNNVINIYGSMVITGNLDLNGANNLTINIFTGGSLTVTGNFITKNNAAFTINSSGSFNVGGSFTVSQNTVANINGDINVAGSMSVGNNAVLNIGSTGTIDVNGAFSAGTNIDLTVNGELDIAGAGTVGSYKNNTLTGTGEIAFGGTTCGNLNCATGCATTPAMNTLTCANFGFVLPVEWKTLSAKKTFENIVISWGTYSEKNNAYFEIEKSSNGVTWEVVGEVKGSGTTSSETNYSILDEDVESGLVYYRIKQVDFDGKFDYSSIVFINVEHKDIIKGLYPNPNNGSFTFLFDQEGETNIVIRNAQGIETSFSMIEINSGIIISLEKIRLGFYTVFVQRNGKTYQTKFVVQ